MKLDFVEAGRILECEANLALTDPLTGPWVARVQRLSEMCAGGAPRTHIAMLGTALLAKATNPAVDVFSLKTGVGTASAYSARSLAKDVLAANAPRLGIDLGVTGREPLNNQPYFRGSRIDDTLASVVRGDARPAFDLVRECLRELAPLSQSEARLALRAFLQVRRRAHVAHVLPEGAAGILETSFTETLAAFVGENSEGGRRAQAVVAGLLDAATSPERVRVARVNDPDRRFPGDVALAEEGDPNVIERSYEVRDKAVTVNDLYSFADKVTRVGVTRAAMVAVAPGQPGLDTEAVLDFTQQRHGKFTLYVGWHRMVSETLFHSGHDPISVLDGAVSCILARLEEIEASEEGIESWMRHVERIRRLSDNT